MRKYRLAKRAKDDLIAIAQYGDEHFGVAQSDRYRDQLKQRFSVLAGQPRLHPAVEHIRPSYQINHHEHEPSDFLLRKCLHTAWLLG